MWIVKFALKNPYTIAVIAALVFLIGGMAFVFMQVDVLPAIDIPVVNIIWQYTGLTAEEMENRVIFVAERGYTTSVNSISKMTSRSIPGIGLIQIYFETDVDIGSAISQITSSSMTALRSMPVGMQPPVVLQFNASNVPVSQLTISSSSIPEEQLFDYAQNFVRMKLFTLPGLSTPPPYGGKFREIVIDVLPELLTAKNLSPQDVVNSLSNSNIIIPAGTVRLGGLEYNVLMNSSPKKVQEFVDLPVKSYGSQTVTIGQVAHVSDGYADQTNVVRINGKRATFLNIIKKSTASTLAVMDELKKALPEIRATSPKGMDFSIDFDQSTFVRAALRSVVTEACIAAFLVSCMILFFLGSWRSVFIVCTSIPLSILVSIICLGLFKQTLNIMTLGGLSMAIGMLVDDATVEVENIHRNMLQEKSLTLAILRGASQVALPAIMSTLAICIVFSPIILLTGPAKFLFTPMALSVVFAMLASYFFSRTLVPVLANMLLSKELKDEGKPPKTRMDRFNKWRDDKFEKLQNHYEDLLHLLLEQKVFLFVAFAAIVVISLALPLFIVGRDFFPRTDAGLIKIHFRARSGTRIEETEHIIARVEDRIRELIPKDELKTINSMIGVPISYSLAYVSSDNIGAMDAEIQIALEEKHHASDIYQSAIRKDIAQNFPGSTVYFQPADLIDMVLNFGQTSTIDLQVSSKQVAQAFEVAQKLIKPVQSIPGAMDAHIAQIFDYPTLNINVDRVRASRLGLTQKDVASSLLIALSSSSLYAPSFYLNPENNVNYSVVAKVPLSKLASVADLLHTPITSTAGTATNSIKPGDYNVPSGQINLVSDTTNTNSNGAPAELLGNVASLSTGVNLDEVDHTDVQRVVDITAGIESRDLGSVSSDIQKEITKLGPLPAGVHAKILGQAEVMNTAFKRLGLGLIVAIILVFLLMVVLFQSWLHPLVILMTLPGSFTGVMWMLSATGTTINVVSLMGSIMAIGIAVSNSILMVSFANDLRLEKKLNSVDAAIEAGKTRLRPVMMTALAMILGMLPMSLALGEAGQQNAPLARAVIGGLLVATFSTLTLIPILYAVLCGEEPKKFSIRKRIEESEVAFDKEQSQFLEAAR